MPLNRLHTLLRNREGDLFACGFNGGGELGVGDLEARGALTRVPFPIKLQSFSAGGYHSVVVDEDGCLWSFGGNYQSQLGIGDTDQAHQLQVCSPVKIPSEVAFTSVSAGLYFTLALDTSRCVWVFGANDYGQLGN
jgi:alpha-tubulin suppressor-like RCC1 family protein